MRLKRTLVGTRLGQSAMRGRDLWDLWRALQANPEQAGTLCQDLCARRLLPRLARPSTVFVDVGAHIGSVLADVRRHDRSVHLIAVEAVPEKAADIQRRFPGATVHSCAVGEQDGEVEFFVDQRRPGYSSLGGNNGAQDGVRRISVPMRRLDDLLAENPAAVDVVKIDVEGAELGVLRGGEAVIASHQPLILFESGPSGGEAMGYSISDLFDWFAAHDYLVFVPNRLAHDGPPLSREGFLECHHFPFRTLNYFAVAAERRIEFRDRAREILGVQTGEKGGG